MARDRTDNARDANFVDRLIQPFKRAYENFSRLFISSEERVSQNVDEEGIGFEQLGKGQQMSQGAVRRELGLNQAAKWPTANLPQDSIIKSSLSGQDNISSPTSDKQARDVSQHTPLSVFSDDKRKFNSKLAQAEPQQDPDSARKIAEWHELLQSKQYRDNEETELSQNITFSYIKVLQELDRNISQHSQPASIEKNNLEQARVILQALKAPYSQVSSFQEIGILQRIQLRRPILESMSMKVKTVGRQAEIIDRKPPTIPPRKSSLGIK